MTLDVKIEEVYHRWYEALEKDSNGLPDWGPVCTGLVIEEEVVQQENEPHYRLTLNEE